ncbi:MAG: NACHT domain-containing protein, partial [Spirochaetota bacterium]
MNQSERSNLQKGFIDPYNSKQWLYYFDQLLPRFRYARFIGLPHLKENPDVSLERLYVPVYMAEQYRSGDAVEEGKKYSIIEKLQESRFHVILGDPGSGKSTLVNYLTTLFASYSSHLLANSLGNMIPIPFVLRDYAISDGISFEVMLAQFQKQTLWPKEKGPDSNELIDVLERGQGLILLDGLDEIGDAKKRKELKKAIIEDGMKQFPNCIWLLTSRIIGYEEVPFHENSSFFQSMSSYIKAPFSDKEGSELAQTQTATKPVYVLPFNTSQIKTYVNKWYQVREADKSLRDQKAKELVQVIQETDNIKHIARNPNMLTMISLIHRVFAQLPSGRVKLYDAITEAYLESIDKAKGFKFKEKDTYISVKEHVWWLSKLAYTLQERRMKQKKEKGSENTEILIPEKDVKSFMTDTLDKKIDPDRELSYIARRSGLLLPRKPGYYNFVHLSFQEYFAAMYLYEGLIISRNETVLTIVELSKQTMWHECLLLLFEKLSEHRGFSDGVFSDLFEEKPSLEYSQVLFIANLLEDLHSGLSIKKQQKAKEFILDRIQKKY